MSSLALKDVYGDDFLLKRSSVYRQIRKCVLRAGYRFTHQAENYFNWPLMHLPWVLSEKRIPYRRNLLVIKAVAKRHGIPLKKILAAPVLVERNVLLHESAHCLAHEVFKKSKTTALKTFLKNRSESFLFEAYFGEACASSSECLLAMQASGRAKLPAEIYLNSYLKPEPAVLRALRDLRKQIGLQHLHELLIHYYFLVNVRTHKLTARQLRAIENAIGIELTASQIKSAQVLFAFAGALNPTFLEITNKLHFRLNGMTQDFVKTRARLKKNAANLPAILQPHVRQFTLQLAHTK